MNSGPFRTKVADYLGQLEGAPLRESQDTICEANVTVHKLDAPANVLIRLAINQRALQH